MGLYACTTYQSSEGVVRDSLSWVYSAAAKAVRMMSRTSAEMLQDPSLDETLVDEAVPQLLPAKDARKSLGKTAFRLRSRTLQRIRHAA